MKRVGALSGVASAILVVVGIFLLIQEAIDEDTNKEIASYYGDNGNRTSELVGFVLVVVGAALFVWFLSSLRARLRSAGDAARTPATLGFGAGVAAAALLVGAAALFSGMSMAAELTDRFVVDPDLARFALAVGFLLLVGWVVVNFALVIATSVVALRSDVLPTWLGWVGFVAVVLAIVEVFLAPVFVIPVWLLIVSIVLAVHEPTRASAT